MSNSLKTQKEKSHAVPKLTPRPTAASAARAAKNAINRSNAAPIGVPPSSQRSPVRSTTAQAVSKVKSAILRYGRSDSKTDVKLKDSRINRNLDIEGSQIQTADSDKDDINFEITEDTKMVEVDTNESLADECQKEVITYDYENRNDEEESSLGETEAAAVVVVSEGDELPSKAPTRPQTPRTATTRPQTPKLTSSRPETPKVATSRPETPVKSSRPTTPAHILRTNTPCSRPSTPITKPRTPTKLVRPTTPISSSLDKSGFKSTKDEYVAREKEFCSLKKELDLKQQAVIKLFENLQRIRERLINEGGSPGDKVTNELVMFNVADWTSDEITQLCRDIGATSTETDLEIFNASHIDESRLEEMHNKALSIPAHFADLCLQAFTARQELIDWLKEYVAKEEIDSEALERITRYNQQGLDMCEALRDLKNQADEAVDMVLLISKRACQERATLISVGQTLVREVARLRQDLKAQPAPVTEIHEILNDSEISKILVGVRKELEEERAAKTAMKEKLSMAETQIKQQKMRIAKMDRQLREAEASIHSLTSTVKSLEDQSRQKEAQFESRARKLKESVRTNEYTTSNLAQQRDALQTEVSELKEQIQIITSQHKTSIQEMTKQLKEISVALEEEQKSVQEERELKMALEDALRESKNEIEALQAKIVELEINKPNPDLPTEREMDLWSDLQATKDTLRLTEEEVTACKREKVRFLETLTKIAESDNKANLEQKLTAELLSKEEIINKMQIQIRQQTKAIKLNEQKVIQYEQYVHNLQAHYRSAVNCQEAPNGISYQDLQQEIMSLKMGLLDSVHRNEELSESLMQKEQQLEQQDKTSRTQARIIKVREELINMLKKKETEQGRELSALQQDLEHRMKIVDEVNKQIAAKADEIQDLFSTLENKQQQIHRLEKIVLALEEQQRRAQAQRTRHEEKIAALEHELAAGGNRRERKFIFF
ncbi:unnamed protein product [Leptidea sinapis]|uniref:Uncharacterized protein n=1 Tax=Leptidea sinapis TaxID=189913 RepID=A0A5E4QYZ8_9NEOP|nr:unnamed protein product [Leptidea sinapis]